MVGKYQPLSCIPDCGPSEMEAPGQTRYSSSDVLVSVLLVTFNHEAYIKQALESVMAQQATFGIEVLISEDYSTDRTREIVQKFKDEYPDQVRLFLSDRNLNDNSVTTRAWAAARGRYIAMLDGDDYWTDPYKLQKQIDFLEQHPDVFVCGHGVNVIDETGAIIDKSVPGMNPGRYISSEGLVIDHGIPTLSIVYRNNKKIPPKGIFLDVVQADTFMLVYFANFGGAYIMNEVMGTYRKHRQGMWTQLTPREAADHSTKTLSRIPMVLPSDLKSLGFLLLLYHSVRLDYSWPRKLRVIPYAAVMLIAHLRYRSLKSILETIAKRTVQLSGIRSMNRSCRFGSIGSTTTR